MSGRVLCMPPVAAHALWAPTYDVNPNPLLSLEERFVRPLLPPLNGLLALDVACGTGRWLENLVRGGSKVAVGVDISSQMLQQASRKPLLAACLVEADCTVMPLRGSSVDFAICSFCLGYMSNLDEFAAELARVVRNGGQLIIGDFHPTAHARGWKRSFRHEDTVIEISGFHRPLEGIVDAFATQGFSLEVCLEPTFGEADRPLFEQCGRPDLFSKVVGEAAIFVCRFTRGAGGRRAIIPGRQPRAICRGTIRARPRAAGVGGEVVTDPEKASLWLVGGRLAVSSNKAVRANVEISDGRIRRVVYGNPDDVPSSNHTITVNLENYLIVPGLINAHDHLEFNLFPRLGRGPYPNSEAWGRDICQPDRSPVREQLAIPKNVRLWWGGLKNLLSGVTTVCHHNPYDPLFEDRFPVRVVRRYGWAHSLVFEKDVAGAFASTHPDEPFIIHLGEGTDKGSEDEILKLDRIGALGRRTILVHGVGFTSAGHSLWQQRGASLVWCPTSNRFTLGATLDGRWVSRLARIALGSDSALTARGNLLDEIHAAHDEEGACADSVYRMVTESAAAILRLSNGEGRARPDAIADLIAIPWKQNTPAEAVVQMDMAQVEMVLVSGQLQLASAAMTLRWPQTALEGLEWISADGVGRRVRAPVSWMVRETTGHVSGPIYLAGKKVSA